MKGGNAMKALKITGKVLLYILVTLILLLLVLRFGVTAIYFDYFNHSKSEFLIPGLASNWVPQGFDYVEEEELYLMCGYMSDGTASRVYVRDDDGDNHFVRLLYADGTPYLKHAGGLCHNGDYLYIAGDDGVDVFSLADVLEGRDAKKLGKIVLGHDMAYCSFYNGYLLAGNFYHAETFETPLEHRITTPAGDANTALMTIFKADENAEFGIDPTPVAAISTQAMVQGIAFTSDAEIVLSTSYSVNSSHLYYHRIDTTRSGTVTACGTEVPLYYLDSATLTNTVTLPPMSEELVYQDGRIHIMCESACNKYFYGKFIRGYQVFSYSE
jgi:hypothetical protein